MPFGFGYQTNLATGGYSASSSMGRGFRFAGPQQPSGEVNLKFGIDSASSIGQFACHNPFGPPNPSGQSRPSGFGGQSHAGGDIAAANFPSRPPLPSFPSFGNTNAAFPPPPPGFDDSASTSSVSVVPPKSEPQDAAEDPEAEEPDCGANEPEEETGGDGDEDGATAPKQQLLSQSSSIADVKPGLSSAAGVSDANPNATTCSAASSLCSFPSGSQVSESNAGAESGETTPEALLNQASESRVEVRSRPATTPLADMKFGPPPRGFDPYPDFIPLCPRGFGARPPPPRPPFFGQRSMMNAPSFPSAGSPRPNRPGFNQRSRSPRPSNRWSSI